jgi:hypothetical protein
MGNSENAMSAGVLAGESSSLRIIRGYCPTFDRPFMAQKWWRKGGSLLATGLKLTSAATDGAVMCELSGLPTGRFTFGSLSMNSGNVTYGFPFRAAALISVRPRVSSPFKGYTKHIP